MFGNRFRIAAMAMGAVLLLAACAKNSSTTPSSGGGGGGGGSSSTGGSAEIDSSSVSGVGTVLVDSSGDTLYYLKSEMSGKINCTGTCASEWPPVLLPSGMSAATAGSGVTGTLGTIKRPDGGTQVTYDKLPLYTFTSDASGQATGQGVNGFFAMPVAGPNGSGSSGSTSSTGTSGGSGYGTGGGGYGGSGNGGGGGGY
jgi:predicted lipoprotein with Yx(FWY)xxD motif